MSLAHDLETYFDRIWHSFHSVTGVGVRQTHDILSEIVKLKRHEIPSGTPIFDWVIPKEWVVREAYLIDPLGKRILDIQENNLHLLNYSIAFKGTISKAELKKHLYSLPNQPTAIPYVTSYYAARWGFCLSQQQRDVFARG